MGIYSFEGGMLNTNEGPDDEQPHFYMEANRPVNVDPIELDATAKDFNEKVLPAVGELLTRAWGYSQPYIKTGLVEDFCRPQDPDSA